MEDTLADIDQFLAFWQTLHIISAAAIVALFGHFLNESIKDNS